LTTAVSAARIIQHIHVQSAIRLAVYAFRTDSFTSDK